MAFNVEKDIFGPAQRAIANLEQSSTACSYCKSTNKGFSVKDNSCNCCGAPRPKRKE